MGGQTVGPWNNAPRVACPDQTDGNVHAKPLGQANDEVQWMPQHQTDDQHNDCRSTIDPLTVEQILAAVKKFPPRTAQPDSLHPRHLRFLSLNLQLTPHRERVKMHRAHGTAPPFPTLEPPMRRDPLLCFRPRAASGQKLGRPTPKNGIGMRMIRVRLPSNLQERRNVR